MHFINSTKLRIFRKETTNRQRNNRQQKNKCRCIRQIPWSATLAAITKLLANKHVIPNIR